MLPSFEPRPDVVLSTDEPDKLRQQLQAILARNDTFPVDKVVKSLMPTTEKATIAEPGTNAAGQALLIVGSPKVKSPSTSAVLGDYVLKQLQQRGWSTESLTLRGNLLNGIGQLEFLEAFDRANLIVLAFPLYIDSLPFLMMKSLEVMARHISAHPQPSPKRLLAIANNGFPEAHHNALALAICQRFAINTNMIWSGGLAMGSGEALSGGQPLEGSERQGQPPVPHIIKALDLASEAVAKEKNVPPEAVKLMAKSPIPLIPFGLWRWLFIKMANQHWRPLAEENQIGQKELLAKPYEEVGNASTK